MKSYQNYINGEWINSDTNETIEVEDPSNKNIIGEVALAKNAEVELAVHSAKKAFEERLLVDMPLIERSRLMKKIAQEASEEPDLLHDAPHNMPNTRLDEALAARRPNLRWKQK